MRQIKLWVSYSDTLSSGIKHFRWSVNIRNADKPQFNLFLLEGGAGPPSPLERIFLITQKQEKIFFLNLDDFLSLISGSQFELKNVTVDPCLLPWQQAFERLLCSKNEVSILRPKDDKLG